MNAEILFQYFPNLTDVQQRQFSALGSLYGEWNQKINVISRKDIDELYLRHVLHSLGIAKIQRFRPKSSILDVGTGGGFPGIPLAILFPEVQFTLVDSIGKKIKVVREVARELDVHNITAVHTRAEHLNTQFDFIVSRAVTAMPTFVKWTKARIKKESGHQMRNGILYLKGGDLTDELAQYKTIQVFDLSDYFKEDFFETKKVVYLPIKYKG